MAIGKIPGASRDWQRARQQVWRCTIGAVGMALALGVQAFDLQGHRGARGLAPENTFPSWQKALELGVNTIECDMAVTRDGVAVVHHDLWLNPSTTRDAYGQWLPGRGPAIKDLTFEQLQRYDVGRIKPGSDYARSFPDQQAADGTRIPQLSELFDLLKRPEHAHVQLDCETKVNPNEPQATLPASEFVQKVIAITRQHGMAKRMTVQSFDWRTLQLIQQQAPEIRTMYLSAPWTLRPQSDGKPSAWLAGFDPAQHKGSVPKTVHAAGGAVWAPNQGFLTPTLVAEAHALGLKVIPWTVNDPAMISRLIDWGIDGIISDYPDRVQAEQKRRSGASKPEIKQSNMPGQSQ